MEQQTTAQASSSRPIWERVETFVREQVQRFMQALLAEAITARLGRPTSARFEVVARGDDRRNRDEVGARAAVGRDDPFRRNAVVVCKTVDQRADMYSFGCMCYELITGKLPFTAINPTELLNKHLKAKPSHISVLNKNVHADFADLVTRMLAKEPKDRPDSLKEFTRILKAGRIFQIKPRKPQPKIEVKEED